MVAPYSPWVHSWDLRKADENSMCVCEGGEEVGCRMIVNKIDIFSCFSAFGHSLINKSQLKSL